MSAAALAATAFSFACGGKEGGAAPNAGSSGQDASGEDDAGAPDGRGDVTRDASEDGDAAGGDEAGAVSCLNNGTATVISSNHGHVLVVSKDDVAAGVEKTYSVQGTAMHTHDVTLTAAHFAALAQDQSITIVSTEIETHTHMVTVTCA